MSPYGRVLCTEAHMTWTITVLCAFTFLHSYHYQVWMNCWKISLFLPATEMLSQKIKREEDYDEHFSRSLLVPREIERAEKYSNII